MSSAMRACDTSRRVAAQRNNVHHVPIALQLSPAAMSRDGFHPGEPIYRACGEALARFVAEHIITTRPRQ